MKTFFFGNSRAVTDRLSHNPTTIRVTSQVLKKKNVTKTIHAIV